MADNTGYFAMCQVIHCDEYAKYCYGNLVIEIASN